MPTRKSDPKPLARRKPSPNNPFGIENGDWGRLCLESAKHEKKWVVWSPGHDKIVAVGEDLMLVEEEVRREGYDVHDVIYEFVQPAPRRVQQLETE